jgi:hypothetical protein
MLPLSSITFHNSSVYLVLAVLGIIALVIYILSWLFGRFR